MRELHRSVDLNVEATLRATINSGGYLVPHWRLKSRPVEHVFLVHSRSRGDHEYERIARILRGFTKSGVALSHYAYTHDPRILLEFTFLGDLHKKLLRLDDVYERHPGARLVIVSSGEELVNPFTLRTYSWVAEFAVWTKRALLTPLPRNQWGKPRVALMRLDFLSGALV